MDTLFEQQLDDYHADVKAWKSKLALVRDELIFIDHLLHSYVFEPRTPNLFERLEQFKTDLKEIKESLNETEEVLAKHDAELSGLLDCETVACDAAFEHRHKEAKEHYRHFALEYGKIKQNIFSYCGKILKSNKK
ncbi:hypothetical protein [Croceiramulus getboli]|nr:hypothetical protein P8624_09575 [Flavobacteriaceae bacterium YJPT1-3]